MPGNNLMDLFACLAVLFCAAALGHAIPAPACMDPFKSPPAELSGLQEKLKQGKLREFYEEADALLGQCASVDNKQITREELALQLWLFHDIAAAPLYPADYDKATPESIFDDKDLDVKHDMLSFLYVMSRDAAPMARRLHLRGKALCDLLATYAAATYAQFRDHYDPNIEAKHEALKKSFIPLNRKYVEEEFKKKEIGSLVNPQYHVFLNKLGVNNNRNELLKNFISTPRMKYFVEMLVNLFPGQSGAVKNYLRMAGYADKEIPDLINRTLGRTPATEFLYRGMPKNVQKAKP
ncbi:hypothetical protein ABGM91_06390 [Akkermansia muciniphila]|uniref:hypothetical protein n=1 Tax=Akkermansia muciniphila TaxID=239935 RepID=UPI0033A1C18F